MGLLDRAMGAVGGALGAGYAAFSKAVTPADDEPTNRNPDLPPSMAMVIGDKKPAQLPPQPDSGEQQPIGLLHDPFAIIDNLGYRDKPSGLTYSTLRTMSKRVPTWQAITQTRLTQVKAFGQPQEDKREPGYAILLRDPKAAPTRQDQIRCRQVEDWIMQTGTVWSHGRDNFKTFLQKVTRDSLDLDQLTFEIQHNRKGDPWAFYAMDGGLMRIADLPPGAEHNPPLDVVKYVQVYDEMVVGEYGPHQLCFGVRNPRTDIRVNGYGYSELEMLIQVITATLYAFDYNKKAFSQGTFAKGLLNFKGTIPDKKIDAFRRHWQMMIAGVNNAHKTPMTNVDEVQWIDLHKSNMDMEYSAWMDWLIKITCAVCQVDPAEIGFNYGNSGQDRQMFASPVESKLTHSRDKGLKPLLGDIALWINTHLIWPLDPRLKFKFMGLDTDSSEEEANLGKIKASYLMTVDELRAEQDLPPLPDGQGEVILDPTWAQWAQGQQMGAEGFGGPDQPDLASMGEDAANDNEGADDGGAASDEGFSQLFGDGQTAKSMAAYYERQRNLEQARFEPYPAERVLSPQRRPRRKAKVKVYEIEL